MSSKGSKNLLFYVSKSNNQVGLNKIVINLRINYYLCVSKSINKIIEFNNQIFMLSLASFLR